MKLDYTDRMKEQDKLWETESEDTNIMENLFNDIIRQAKQKGFNGYYVIYQVNNECVCEIYNSEEEYEKCCNGEEDSEFLFGYCKPLIECLEKYYLN
jgi:hypothetical protein